jgi:hypothetical protein
MDSWSTPEWIRRGYAADQGFDLGVTRAAAEVVAVGNLINALIPGDTRTAMNPTAKQEPEAVYPYLRELVTLPACGPSGKVFRYGAEYPLFQPKGDGMPVALPRT